MRKLSISLVAMIMASFGFAQNSNTNFESSKFKALGALGLNYEYRNKVQNSLTPNQVKYLEDVVSHWDVAKSEGFDDRKVEPFNVTFKLEDGYIMATYNSKGKVVSAFERFRNFALPKPVAVAIARQYPDWQVVKNKYSLLYNKGKRAKKALKVKIKKGNQKKWLKIDLSDSIL